MVQASQIVFGDFALTSDAKVIKYPGRFLEDDAEPFWNTVIAIYEQVKVEAAEKLNTNLLENLTPVQSNISY